LHIQLKYTYEIMHLSLAHYYATPSMGEAKTKLRYKNCWKDNCLVSMSVTYMKYHRIE